jgi:hypothetical protein
MLSSASRQKIGALFLALFLSTACGARAQQPGQEAMRKLAFLSGAWACTVKGGSSNGFVQEVKYSLSPDGLWLSEVSLNSEPNSDGYATQMWGYDARTGKLVAYNFGGNGVYTKSVQGWVDGEFTSRRDDNGATVALKPIADRNIQWIITSSDGSSIVKEDCVRR